MNNGNKTQLFHTRASRVRREICQQTQTSAPMLEASKQWEQWWETTRVKLGTVTRTNPTNWNFSHWNQWVMSITVVKFTLSVLTHLKRDSDETSQRQLDTINRVMCSASNAIVGEYRLYIINYAKYNKSTKLMHREQFIETMSGLQRQFKLQNTIGMRNSSNSLI